MYVCMHIYVFIYLIFIQRFAYSKYLLTVRSLDSIPLHSYIKRKQKMKRGYMPIGKTNIKSHKNIASHWVHRIE